MNRWQRRAGLSVHKKNVRQALNNNDWGEWVDVTSEMTEKLISKGRNPDGLIGYFKNNIYSVQTINYSLYVLIGIRRHDESTDIPWSHKQRIKNEILGKDVNCAEMFPEENKLIDGANMYWLWTMKEGLPLKEALEGVYG